MIEDPKFTLEVLRYFAKDDIPYPANKVPSDLPTSLKIKGLEYLNYHITCAMELKLLYAKITHTETMDGNVINIDYIDGLSAKGGEYVRNADFGIFEKAWDSLKENAIPITTSNLINKILAIVSTLNN